MAQHTLRQPLRIAAGAFFCTLLLQGCTVISVAGTAVSVTASAVGLAADAAVGTARIVGKGVGKAADALMDDDEDHSGVAVRYRISEPASTAGQAVGPETP